MNKIIGGTTCTPLKVSGVLVVSIADSNRDKATHSSSEIYSHISNGGTAVFYDGVYYYNLTTCEKNEAVFCQVMDDNTIYRLVVSDDYGFEEQEIYNIMDIVNKTITDIQKDIADLKYVPIDITSISNNVGVVEMGRTINVVILSWTTNKTPVSLTVDGESVDANAESIQLNTTITSNKTFTVVATDERDATDTATTGITFYNGVYYGVGTETTDLLTLNKKLQSGKGITFTANAADGQYIIYALPTRYGTPNFNVGGFDGGFSKLMTINFTNASGYTENYDVWVSDNTGLGNTTVKVS